MNDIVKFLLFSGGNSAKTVRPLSNKRHILGMLASPRNDSCRPKLWHLSCTCTPASHPKPPKFALGACKTPCILIWKFFMPVTTRTPIHICCFTNGWKAALYSYSCTIWWNPWGYPPPCCCVIPDCHSSLIFLALSKSVHVWGSYSRKKTIPWPAKVIAI